MYKISSNHYLPLLYVHIIALEELCDTQFNPIFLMKLLPLVRPPHPAAAST